MTDTRQIAGQRVNLRMSEEEVALMEEIRSLLEQRVKSKGKLLKDLPMVKRVTQRDAVVESMRYYIARLRDLERPH